MGRGTPPFLKDGQALARNLEKDGLEMKKLAVERDRQGLALPWQLVIRPGSRR